MRWPPSANVANGSFQETGARPMEKLAFGSGDRVIVPASTKMLKPSASSPSISIKVDTLRIV
jgi:hypothetical protein